MKSVIVIGILVSISWAALADELPSSRLLAPPSVLRALTVRPMCVEMPALRLCPGDPPTVWMDPKAKPRDIARRLLEAIVQLGFREQ